LATCCRPRRPPAATRAAYDSVSPDLLAGLGDLPAADLADVTREFGVHGDRAVPTSLAVDAQPPPALCGGQVVEVQSDGAVELAEAAAQREVGDCGPGGVDRRGRAF